MDQWIYVGSTHGDIFFIFIIRRKCKNAELQSIIILLLLLFYFTWKHTNILLFHFKHQVFTLFLILCVKNPPTWTFLNTTKVPRHCKETFLIMWKIPEQDFHGGRTTYRRQPLWSKMSFKVSWCLAKGNKRATCCHGEILCFCCCQALLSNVNNLLTTEI